MEFKAISTYYGMALIKKYFKLTEKHKNEYGPKTIVYIQVGAFFEVYGLKHKNGDITGSELIEFTRIAELKIANKKICVGKKNVVMAGFRDYTIDKYIKKLNDQGYTIAVYTQDIQASGSPRSLYGIYSPGTNFSSDSQKLTNNIMCIKIKLNKKTIIINDPHFICGISTINIITGKSVMFEFEKKFFHDPTTYDEIERFGSIYQPHELIIIYSGFDENQIKEIIQFTRINTKTVHLISTLNKENIHSEMVKNIEHEVYQIELLNRFFEPSNMDFFFDNLQFANYPLATQSFCFLLHFLFLHQPNLVKKISEPDIENINNHLHLANHSLKQLNIINTNQHSGKLSSVLSFLNDCRTPMGKRKFKKQLLKPTIDVDYLKQEYEIIKYVKDNYENFDFLRDEFTGFRDIEKLYRKIILNKVCPDELVQFVENMKSICLIDKKIKRDKQLYTYVQSKMKDLDITKICKDLIKEISSKIIYKRAEQVNKIDFDINIFKRDIFPELDTIEEAHTDSLDKMYCIQKWLGGLIHTYDNKKDPCKLVRVHETEKCGYNLDITKRRSKFLKDKLINNKIHYKSRFDGSERILDFVSEEIKFSVRSGSNMRIDSPQLTNIYNSITANKQRLKGKLEVIYRNFINSLSKWQNSMENMVKYVSLLDVLITKAYTAKKYNYCCPEIENKEEKSFFIAKGIRHCLIEHINKNEIYVPNDISLGHTEFTDGMLLYGTNQVGKTSLIRSIGICVVLAQAGMFVPCNKFIYKPYTSIFTRILGNDDLFKGMSTFAVEMSELRTILTSADENSLILGDELCKGTESESAISIFVAGLTTLHEIRSSFIFATHLHQITGMARVKGLENLKMNHLEVKYNPAEDLLIYDRTLKEGPGDSLYGLEVCKSLSLPKTFLDLAYRIRNEKNKKIKKSKYNARKIKGKCEVCDGKGDDIHHLEYQEDANKDGFIDHFHKNHPGNLINICKKCHDKIHTEGARLHKRKTNKGMKIFKI